MGKERNKLSTQLGGVYACFGHLSLIFVVSLADAEPLWTVGMHWGALSQCSHKKGGKKVWQFSVAGMFAQLHSTSQQCSLPDLQVLRGTCRL